MGAWDLYERRMVNSGLNKHDVFKSREARYITNNIKDNLSYHTAILDGVEQNVSIINSDNLNEKKIYSLPGETIRHGALVEWMDNYWLVTEKDANNTIYERGKLLQCNHLLKWVSSDGVIHEQWCVVEDGTKYLTGEYEDRNFVITRGDSRISVIIAINENTVKLNRRNRFLIDNDLSEPMLAYQLTKPLKLGGTFNGKDGVFKFVLQEVTTTDLDNQELGIADYYKYYPREESSDEDDDVDIPLFKDDETINAPSDDNHNINTGDTDDNTENKRKVWI